MHDKLYGRILAILVCAHIWCDLILMNVIVTFQHYKQKSGFGCRLLHTM